MIIFHFRLSNFINLDRQKGVLVMKNVHEHEREEIEGERNSETFVT